MYRFPQSISEDEQADKICREHINKVLLYMVDRYIDFERNEDGSDKITQYLTDDVEYLFPEAYWGISNQRFIWENFFKLRKILTVSEDITPEPLLEYVIARMSTCEAANACDDVITALVVVICEDRLNYEMSEEYEPNHPVKNYRTIGNSKSRDERRWDYQHNCRLLIKEALNTANFKKESKVFTQKEALKFLKLIEEKTVEELGYLTMESNTVDRDFIINKYAKMFCHPSIYKIPKEDRIYVIEKITEDIKEVLNECLDEGEVITKKMITDELINKLSEIEDTRTYDGSETIFWDLDYTLFDDLDTDETNDLDF